MVRQLDSLEEHREAAIIRLADYQQKLPQQYNKAVKERESSVLVTLCCLGYQCQEVGPELERIAQTHYCS